LNPAFDVQAVQCTAINKTYVATVSKAKVCCPMCDMIQCSLEVQSDLACGCGTYVEGTTTAAASLKSLKAQWSALGCDTIPWQCPAMPCVNVLGGDCQGGWFTGKCQDISTP